MARLPHAAQYALWILFLPYATNEVMAAGHVQDFACFTDYDTELVCHWKVPGQTNCSKEFLLYYRSEFISMTNDVCMPENGLNGLRCTCTIHSDFFVSGLTYVLALQHNGTDMWNYSVTPARVVKPRAPKNLAIQKVENGNFNLSWEDSYSPLSALSGRPVIYEVKYRRKQHPTEASVKAINYQTKSFEIAASSLRRGYDYVASVRCNYTDYPAYWSEWSEEVEFHCDYQVTAEDILQMAVPVACILILAVSVICYFCFTKVKKEWWDQIPNPAKSHLVVKNVKFSVLSYIDEIKFPFHDLKQSDMETHLSCKSCLAQSLSSQNFKGKDNIRNVEKSCSCQKSGEWFPKGNSAVLTPETVLVEESIEICEHSADIEAESQGETSDQTIVFEPCESSVSAFREHAEHNNALASMFIELLADENSMQDDKDPGITTGENKLFHKLASENSSLQNPKESAAQNQQQPCDISHTVSLFTEASQGDYNCSTASKKSGQSEVSFKFCCQNSRMNCTSLDAKDIQHMVQQSLFPCSFENQHDLCVLIQASPNIPSFGTKKDRISNPAQKSSDTVVSPSMGLLSSAYKSFDALTSPSVEPCSSAYKSFDSLTSPSMEPCGSAYKSFDSLTSPSMEPCGSAYKSFDSLMSPSVEPCGSAYKSFDILVSAFEEPSTSAYKSFDTLMSQSMAKSSPTHVCSSPLLVQFLETPELSCRDQIDCPPSNQICYTNCRSPCAKLDFPSLSTHANDSVSAFLPGEEIHKQVIYQNIQKEGSIIPCPTGPQPSVYQLSGNADEFDGTHCDNDSEVISGSLYDPFIRLLYSNLRGTSPDAIICEPDQRGGDRVCLAVPGCECSIVPGLVPSQNVTQTGDGSLWIIHSNALSRDSRDENTTSSKQLLYLLQLNCQDFDSRGRIIKGTKPKNCSYSGKGMQESSSNSLNPEFHCHMHNHLRKLGNAGENKEVMQHPVGRRCGSAGSSPEESLDSIGLNVESETAELLELMVSGKLSPPLFVDNSCPCDSLTIHNEGSRLALAVNARPVELLRENNGKNKERVKLIQALAQEDNCYMKVA